MVEEEDPVLELVFIVGEKELASEGTWSCTSGGDIGETMCALTKTLDSPFILEYIMLSLRFSGDVL